MAHHFKVHEELTRVELDALEAFAREPGRTVDEVHEHLLAEGFTIGRTACWQWLRMFLDNDRFAASNDVARSLVDAAKAGGTVAISDAATLQLSQMLFEQLLKLQSEEAVDTKELWAASMALKNVIGAKGAVEQIKVRFDEQIEAAKAKRRGGALTPEELESARKAIFG